MPPRRILPLALAGDLVAVAVFAALGRMSHGESADVLGLLGTAAPFAVGVLAAWAVPAVRIEPVGMRAGAVVLTGAAVGGLLLRAAFTGPPPLSFVIVTALVMAVLLLGWRAFAGVVARAGTGRPVR